MAGLDDRAQQPRDADAVAAHLDRDLVALGGGDLGPHGGGIFGAEVEDLPDLDAAAVKFHFDAILDPQRASPVRPIIAALESVDAPDATTVRFNFSRPFAPFMTIIAGGAYGINSPTAVQRLGRQYGH